MSNGPRPDYYQRLAEQPSRPVEAWECEVLQILASDAGLTSDAASLLHAEAREARTMDDGGIGSVQLMPPSGDTEIAAFDVVERWYVDTDRVLVSFTINLNDSGEIVELDVWKVDCAPLLRPPKRDELNRSQQPGAHLGRPS